VSLLIFFLLLSPLLLLGGWLVGGPVYLDRNFVLSVTSGDVCGGMRGVKWGLISDRDAFVSGVCRRCLCVVSDQTEMAKEKEYLMTTSFVFSFFTSIMFLPCLHVLSVTFIAFIIEMSHKL